MQWPLTLTYNFKVIRPDLENCVSSVASTVLDGFFPYLVQMITNMRCVACDDLWPWPISSRSFDLYYENRVRYVTFSVLDRLFSYLPQITTTIRGCVACKVYNEFYNFNFSLIFRIFLGYFFSFTNTKTIYHKRSILIMLRDIFPVELFPGKKICVCWSQFHLFYLVCIASLINFHWYYC